MIERELSPQEFAKKMTGYHTVLSLTIAGLAYFNGFDAVAKALFFASLVLNIYLRVFTFSFNALIPSDDPRNKILVGVLSALRAAFAAGLLALLVLKFELNLIGIGLAIFAYIVVLLSSGFFFKKKPLGV